MQNRTWITEFQEKRMQIGISEQDMALEAGLTEEYYRRLEQENQSVPQKVRKRLKDALIRLHPEPLTLLFDYVRIRFPTMDVKHIIEDVLRLKMKYLVQEPRGMYGYTSTYQIGDVLVLTSPLEGNGRAFGTAAAKAVGSLKRIWTDKSGLGTNFSASA